MAHTSYFEYQITRPYPFKWFTPVAIGGGILLSGLFAFVTIATNGYEPRNLMMLVPNATLDHHPWFTKPPFSWRDNVKTACPPVNLVTGISFVTHNLGFTYDLYSVSKIQSDNQISIPTASVPYTNQVLRSCQLIDITLNFKKVGAAPNRAGGWWIWDDSWTRARANCTISTTEGDFLIEFSTTIPADGITEFGYVTQANISTSASIWWGTRLINTNWMAVLTSLSQLPSLPDAADSFWTGGSMQLKAGDITDIRSGSFFTGKYRFVSSDGSFQAGWNLPESYNNNNAWQSSPITAGYAFARIVYSTILVDLGQSETPNVLLDKDLLQWALATPDDVFRNDPGDRLNCTNIDCNPWYLDTTSIAGPFNTKAAWPDSQNDTRPEVERAAMKVAYATYTPGKPGMGSLGSNQTTILTQYTCSVPTIKDGGSLCLIVLIALLVYLSTAWTLLGLIAKSIVVRKDPAAAQTCPGCMHTPDLNQNDKEQLLGSFEMTAPIRRGPFVAVSTDDTEVDNDSPIQPFSPVDQR